MDYIKWRGDLSLLDFPYNQVDYLILSNLAYVHLDGIDFSHPMTLSEAFVLYQQLNELNKKEVNPIFNESHYLFEEVVQSKRYCHIKIINYINEVNDQFIEQFSATSFLLENDTLFIGFRGTDDSLVGWHENFLMLCDDIIPSHLSALKYLNDMSDYNHIHFFHTLKNKNLGHFKKRILSYFRYKKEGLPIILGGHSKGGNLAMYAGCFVDERIQNRIDKIYNYDGPGFQENITHTIEYQRMLPRIISYIPHYSFFGIVLCHEEKYEVVHSQLKGLNQHNSFSWTVTKDDFIKDELSFESVQFAVKIILFLEKLSYEDKKNFITMMFELFHSLHLYTFTDLSHMTYKHILSAIKEISSFDNKMKKILIDFIRILYFESRKK